MKVLAALTADELKRAEERLLNPKPGSRIAAARDFGIDLTLLVESLRLTPAERARRMHAVIVEAESIRGIARRKPT